MCLRLGWNVRCSCEERLIAGRDKSVCMHELTSQLKERKNVPKRKRARVSPPHYRPKGPFFILPFSRFCYAFVLWGLLLLLLIQSRLSISPASIFEKSQQSSHCLGDFFVWVFRLSLSQRFGFKEKKSMVRWYQGSDTTTNVTSLRPFGLTPASAGHTRMEQTKKKREKINKKQCHAKLSHSPCRRVHDGRSDKWNQTL